MREGGGGRDQYEIVCNDETPEKRVLKEAARGPLLKALKAKLTAFVAALKAGGVDPLSQHHGSGGEGLGGGRNRQRGGIHAASIDLCRSAYDYVRRRVRRSAKVPTLAA